MGAPCAVDTPAGLPLISVASVECGAIPNGRESPADRLIAIVKEINDLEDLRLEDKERQKLVAKRLITYSVISYSLASLAIIVFISQPEQRRKFANAVPVLISPFLLWAVRRISQWFHARRNKRKQSRLAELEAEKIRVVNTIMDTETFRVASQILHLYAPEHVKRLNSEECVSILPSKDECTVCQS
ncbi:unnamed protein product [Notodromas monacha]|uniref:Uncharacterized protein n=1 Tax=Notodromas monacha TaxID=399045 RepID=A0A7R9BSM9_9CRUS|nr:unnamed protein product [Notodromas monacha]CAG0919595.1 unnamed protein product [Notodromas monacha]